MAFVMGRGLGLVDRWANTLYFSYCFQNRVQLPAGDIELGIDRSSCYSFTFNLHPMYVPINVTDAVGDCAAIGTANGLGEAQTNLYFYPDQDHEDGTFAYDFRWIDVATTTNRTRVIEHESINFYGPQGGPSAAVFKNATNGLSRLSVAAYLKHTGVNDFATVSMIGQSGDWTRFSNCHVMQGSRFTSFLETSSGAYSGFQFDDCTLRGYHQCLNIFGAGPSDLQPLGKRLVMNNVHIPAVYAQPPGSEITGLGGNGIYVHPTVAVDWDGGSCGTAGGGTAEWIPERGIYFNGGTVGYAPDQYINNVVFHPNCYQGIKCAAGVRQDGGRGRYYFTNLQLLSYYRALTNDDAEVLCTDFTCAGGAISGTNTDGATLTLDRGTIDVQYLAPPAEYLGSLPAGTHDLTDSLGGHVTAKHCAITLNAGRHVSQGTTGSTCVLEDCTVTAVGDRSAFAVMLVSGTAIGSTSNGVLRRVTATGTIRPFYHSRIQSGLAEDCDFSGCLTAPRLFDVDAYRSSVVRCLLPDLALTIDASTEAQRWLPYPQDAAGTVASAATLTLGPNADRVTVTGSTTISTINMKASTANIAYDDAFLALRVGVGASWALSASGNITPLHTSARTPGALVLLQYDAATSRWAEVADTAAPTFGGATDAEATGESSILVSWSAGRDIGTEDAGITYLVLASTFPGGESSDPIAAVVGASSVEVVDLSPLTTYYFIVRARDAAGNVDDNLVEVSATTDARAAGPSFSRSWPQIRPFIVQPGRRAQQRKMRRRFRLGSL